jgi:hypothetical protein
MLRESQKIKKEAPAGAARPTGTSKSVFSTLSESFPTRALLLGDIIKKTFFT